jgi:protein-disulfide isomerase
MPNCCYLHHIVTRLSFSNEISTHTIFNERGGVSAWRRKWRNRNQRDSVYAAQPQELIGNGDYECEKIDIFLIVLFLISAVQGAVLYRNRRTVVPSEASFTGNPQAIQDVANGKALDLSGVPLAGSSTARIVIAEFSDYDCPFCARHFSRVLPELKRKFIETGRVKYTFLNNPLPIHRGAELKATAALCAGEHNRYWEMHDRLFSDRPTTRQALVDIAHSIELDRASFARCLDENSNLKKQVERDKRLAQDLGLFGTPTFALGIIDNQGQFIPKKSITGAQPVTAFETAINELVSSLSDDRSSRPTESN